MVTPHYYVTQCLPTIENIIDKSLKIIPPLKFCRPKPIMFSCKIAFYVWKLM